LHYSIRSEEEGLSPFNFGISGQILNPMQGGPGLVEFGIPGSWF